MKHLIFALLALALMALVVMRLIDMQDAEYERYSRQARKDCAKNEEKKLEYDKELRYWRCVPPKE